jgi:anti-anti-sigma factor
MATDWSESIVIAELSDEPALSEELHSIGDRLARKVSQGPTPSVVLNFANVTYVNSSNLASLLKIRKVLAEKGRGLRLCSLSPEVYSVMTVTGLDKVFRFAPDPMTALAGLQIEDANRAEA